VKHFVVLVLRVDCGEELILAGSAVIEFSVVIPLGQPLDRLTKLL
jgi:hypothetical protein